MSVKNGANVKFYLDSKGKVQTFAPPFHYRNLYMHFKITMKKIISYFLAIVFTIAGLSFEAAGQTRPVQQTVYFHKDTLRLVVGQEDTVKATAVPDAPIHWDAPASIPVIASIAPPTSSARYGKVYLVKGRKVGKTKVIVQVGAAKDTCWVFVSPRIPVKEVRLNKDTVRLKAGQTQMIQAGITPQNATDKTLNWRTKGRATVTPSATNHTEALITAAAVTDTTLIIAEAKDGSKCSDTCVVITRVPLDSICLNKDTLRVDIGGKDTLRAMVYPSQATNRSLNWMVKGKATVTPSSDTDTVAFIAAALIPDTTYVIVEAKDSSYYRDTCVIITREPGSGAVVEVNDQHVYASEGYVHIHSGKPVSLRIYTISGALYRREEGVVGDRAIPLPRGFYIVVLNHTGKKIFVR